MSDRKKRIYLSNHFGTTVRFSLLAGIITHLFGLVNTLHNYDDICMQPYGYGTGITSGRWFLTILGNIAEFFECTYNIPLVNGILFLILLSVSAGFLVSTLNIRSKVFSILVGMLFTVFPSATSTLFFKYTVPYYGLAILLSVLAAWVMHRCKFAILLSASFTALSLGIYQAYTPITIGLFVLMLLQYTLSGKHSLSNIIRRGIYYCASLVLGLLLYFLCLKILLSVSGNYLSGYQNVDKMGQITWSTLPSLLYESFSALCLLPRINYCGLATTRLLKLMYFTMGGYSLLLVSYILVTTCRKPLVALVAALLCILFPIAVNFIVVMCPDSIIYTIMVYGFVLVPCFPLVVFECLPSAAPQLRIVKNIFYYGIAFAISVVIAFYSYEANVSYSALYYSNRQTENYLSSIITQVRMTDGFTHNKKWVFIGDIQDPLLSSPWEYETRYGGNQHTKKLLNAYSRIDWISNYIGYKLPQPSVDEISALSQNAEVKSMPCWPDQGSIKVIDNAVVIKFQDLS